MPSRDRDRSLSVGNSPEGSSSGCSGVSGAAGATSAEALAETLVVPLAVPPLFALQGGVPSAGSPLAA
eukprot:806902-Karenia_brevis.AAC.1